MVNLENFYNQILSILSEIRAIFSKSMLSILILTALLSAQTRKPSVAGQFYPRASEKLRKTCQYYLQQAGPRKLNSRPIGIIVPHAGYVYSGRIAAIGFNEIKSYEYDAIIILAPSHMQAFSFASIYSGDYYETPLGKLKVDKALCNNIAAQCKYARISSKGHKISSNRRGEHSIEVEIPFIQIVQPEVPIVPILFGTLDYSVIEELGEALRKISKENNILIVASSDLSHYHSYSEANKIDKKLISSLQNFEPLYFYQGIKNRKYEACGAAPITTLLYTTKSVNSQNIHILEYANSGDIKGADKSRVVGYLSAVITQENNKKINKGTSSMNEQKKQELSTKDKKFLLDIAYKSIKAAVTNSGKPDPDPATIPETICQERGAFVTINKKGKLRGCIGYVMPVKPLWKAVREMAESAAMKDPRFPAIQEDELEDIEIEISVLTVPEKIENIEDIEVGKHGLIIKRGFQQGLLLPQVAVDHNWDRNEFLKYTCRKAGLPMDAWNERDTDIKIFSAQVFNQSDLEG